MKRRLEHFDWFAYYQVEQWSQQEIEDGIGVDRITVRDELQAAGRPQADAESAHYDLAPELS